MERGSWGHFVAAEDQGWVLPHNPFATWWNKKANICLDELYLATGAA